jgi:P-type Mg2+ transporter
MIAAIERALPFTPIGAYLGFVPLPPLYWVAIAIILPSYDVLTHLMKGWFIRQYGLS